MANPGHGSLLVLASQLVRECSLCWLTWRTTLAFQPWWLQYLAIVSFPSSLRNEKVAWPTRNWLDHSNSAVISLQFRTALKSFLLCLFLPSTLESDEQFSSTQRVPPLRGPLLVRLLLVLLSQYLSSRVSTMIRYGWYCAPLPEPLFGI